MFEQNRTVWNKKRIRQLTDVRNVTLYIFALVAMAIAWSSVKTLQSNYELQKQISVLRQQNAVLELENQNTALNNEYLQTDEYLDLSARQHLGLSAPGETVLLVPREVALKYVDGSINTPVKTEPETEPNKSRYKQNLEAWRDFLLGRRLVEQY